MAEHRAMTVGLLVVASLTLLLVIVLVGLLAFAVKYIVTEYEALKVRFASPRAVAAAVTGLTEPVGDLVSRFTSAASGRR